MNILILLTALGMGAMFGGIFKLRGILMPVLVLGLIGSLGFVVNGWGQGEVLFNMIRLDNYALVFSSVCIVGAIFIIVFYHLLYFDKENYLEEVYALIIFSLIGVVALVSFINLLMLFLGIEILSLSLYVMAGLRKRDLLSNESSMKYFLMGAFSTGFLLFGIALLYGAAGSFDTDAIASKLPDLSVNPLMIAGILLIMIGLLFKVAAVPFQFWTPDVYQGAPTIITAYMATVGKVAAFAAFLRLFELSLSPAKESYQMVFWIVAVLTMLSGNIIAIYQRSVKRMLAYSSIAHAGYMLIALTTANSSSGNAVLFYSASYTFASIASFMVVLIIQEAKGNDEQTSFDGLAKSQPWLAMVLAISMLSLAGIPPTAGFFAKFYIFSSAVSDGWIWIVVFAVISSFISLYYYLRPVIAAYMHKGHAEGIIVSRGVLLLLVILSVLTLVLGILPGFIAGLI